MKIAYEDDAIKNCKEYLQAGSPQLVFHSETYWQNELDKSTAKRSELINKYNNLLEKMKIR